VWGRGVLRGVVVVVLGAGWGVFGVSCWWCVCGFLVGCFVCARTRVQAFNVGGGVCPVFTIYVYSAVRYGNRLCG